MMGVKKAGPLELKLMEAVRDLEDNNSELQAELGVKEGEVRVLCERVDEKDSEIAELRADLEFFASHRGIAYRDRISYTLEPFKAWSRQEREYDGTTADLLRVIRAARKGD